MRRIVLVVVMGTVLLLAGACDRGDGKRALVNGTNPHGQQDKTADSIEFVFADVIKSKKLADYSTSTIGAAFGTYRYFDKREWKETKSSDGKVYVDFWGWFNTGKLDAASIKNGIVARGIEAKFVIYPDGKFNLAMISKIEARADGQKYAYPLADKKCILDAIYANKVIAF